MITPAAVPRSYSLVMVGRKSVGTTNTCFTKELVLYIFLQP